MYRIGEEEINAVARVIRSGNMFKINDGLQEVKHFEEELREKFGTENAILMTSGKAALISALIGNFLYRITLLKISLIRE